jgi:hypothetical protein
VVKHPAKENPFPFAQNRQRFRPRLPGRAMFMQRIGGKTSRYRRQQPRRPQRRERTREFLHRLGTQRTESRNWHKTGDFAPQDQRLIATEADALPRMARGASPDSDRLPELRLRTHMALAGNAMPHVTPMIYQESEAGTGAACTEREIAQGHVALSLGKSDVLRFVSFRMASAPMYDPRHIARRCPKNRELINTQRQVLFSAACPAGTPEYAFP